METNDLGYPIFSESMLKQLYGSDFSLKHLNEQEINDIICFFKKFNIKDPLDETNIWDGLPQENFNIAQLDASNLKEQFELMAKDIIGDTKKLLQKFLMEPEAEKPRHVNNLKPGWNKYICGEWIEVKGITEEVIVFDTETFVQSKVGNWAIIASIYSASGYYLWVHPAFLNTDVPFTKELLDLGAAKVVIGFNVCFDACRVGDNYELKTPRYHYIDIRSMFNICHGLTSDLMILFDTHKWDTSMNPYARYGAKANLKDAYNFYFRHTDPLPEEAKEIRNVFVDASTLEEMHKIGGRDNLLMYALRDAYTTYKLTKAVWPEYQAHNPSAVPLAAKIIMGSPKLPLRDNFWDWFQKCEDIFHEKQANIDKILRQIAEEIIEYVANDPDVIEVDPFLCHLDWETNSLTTRVFHKCYWVALQDTEGTLDENNNNVACILVHKDEKVNDALEEIALIYNVARTKSGAVKKKKRDKEPETQVPRYPHLYEIPKWFLPFKNKDTKISTKTQVSHYLLGLRWLEKPVFYTQDSGWCYIDDSGVRCKVPHKKGEEYNVGCMLTSDFIRYYEDGLMQANNEKAAELLKESVACSYWLSARSRVAEILTCHVNNPYGKDALMCAGGISPNNTISGRGGEKLWYTVPGTEGNQHKIGTEIKSRVAAPDGWVIIGGDADSQEAQIFAMYADTSYGISGSTPCGNINLVGNKDNGTDVHSLLAKVAGIKRKDAKTINYALQYSAGARTIDLTLAKANPTMSKEERKNLVDRILKLKKGDLNFGRYNNGMDSEGFNYILNLLELPFPVTPFLQTQMSQAIMPCHDVQQRNFTSIMNWTVQRSGVDFLSCWLVAIMYLSKKYNVGALFNVSLHDETFVLVPKHNAEKGVAIFAMAHIWTWAYFHQALNLYDLPLRRALISGIYVGNCWSKSLHPTNTISNKTNDQEGKELTPDEYIPLIHKLFAT